MSDIVERLRLSGSGDCPEPENAASKDNESVRKTGGDFGQPSGASAGSHGSPVAWVAFAADASESRALFLTRDAAERAARKHGWFVAELFARPTLTDEEREAIKRAIDSQQRRAAEMHSRSWTAAAIDDDCDTLRGMLERLG